MTEKIDMISKTDYAFENVEALGLKPSQKFLFFQLRKRGFDLESATKICHETKCECFGDLLEVVE